MKYFNHDIAIKYSANEQIFQKIGQSFIDSYEKNRDILISAYLENIESFLFEVHSIKGISLNIGAVSLFEISSLLTNNYSLDKFSEDDFKKYLEVLHSTYIELKNFLVK